MSLQLKALEIQLLFIVQVVAHFMCAYKTTAV